MANYRTHVSYGIASGASVAVIGTLVVKGMDWEIMTLSIFFGFIGSMVPDIDHDTGHALHKIMDLFTTIFPVMLAALFARGSNDLTNLMLLFILPAHYYLHKKFRKYSIWKKYKSVWYPIKGILISAICSFPVIFLLTSLPWGYQKTIKGFAGLWLTLIGIAIVIQASLPILKKLTIHRGILHSVPAILLYTELVFLLLYHFDQVSRLIITFAALAGALSHLILDEIYAVDFDGKKIRLKRSFGTALSIWKKKYPYISFSAYALCVTFGYFCFLRY